MSVLRDVRWVIYMSLDDTAADVVAREGGAFLPARRRDGYRAVHWFEVRMVADGDSGISLARYAAEEWLKGNGYLQALDVPGAPF